MEKEIVGIYGFDFFYSIVTRTNLLDITVNLLVEPELGLSLQVLRERVATKVQTQVNVLPKECAWCIHQ